MPKQNCWEYKKCGREPNGPNVFMLGVCPAAKENKLDGTHGGKNAGRACWVVAGTLCHGKVQGSYALKLKSCLECDFYNHVSRTEKSALLSLEKLLRKLEE